MRSLILSIGLAVAMLAGNMVWPDSADAQWRRWRRWYGATPVRSYYRPSYAYPSYYAYPRYYGYPYRYAYRYGGPGYYW